MEIEKKVSIKKSKRKQKKKQPKFKLKTRKGRVIFPVYNNENERLSECAVDLAKPLALYPHFDALLDTVVPREKLLTPEKIKKLSNEKLLRYQRAIDFWHTLWFLQKYQHYHHECRTCEIPGESENNSFWRAPPLSIPVRANVLTFEWDKFIKDQKHLLGRGFDVIVTDPPWTLATEKQTRGVALHYDQITDSKLINAVPWYDLASENAIVFMWVINAKMTYALNLLKEFGFNILENMTWVKMSSKRLLARGHGYYFQHAKEECIIATKGNRNVFRWEKCVSNLMASKRCQSQKPASFYDMVECVAPNASYLEVFARRNNLRNGWVSIGNQL